ncbi:hypothetical protein BOTBODRAFT_119147 [Botryobasidium botryosum FD-172 SS1]|uniref:Uncharacterized protein n=1 Tax=Botryobasidium botryosum (strain FD-172 SS1) TaxID=930990 RepID=A0A067LXG5_BOTB1|nr:hypothetical protein BOTBODRAFT_119147 [Botryobasidium botryosum FD-172 SS1]
MRYLHHTGIPGGGAPNRSKLALDKYRCMWKDLREAQKKKVVKEESAQYTWINRHNLLSVFSIDCKKCILTYTEPSARGENPPCDPCADILDDKRFKNALRRKMPNEDHMRFAPTQYRPELLSTIWAMQAGVRQLVEMV